MKTFTCLSLLACVIATASASAYAAAGHEGHATPHAAAPLAVPLADGLVKKIDKAAGKVTLAHGPLPNGMPGMTMTFRVKNTHWLDKMKVGQKIRFAAEEVGDTMTIVRVEPAK